MAKVRFGVRKNYYTKDCIVHTSQLSNDRLLRVRSEQAVHLFDSAKFDYTPANCVRAGDLCMFSVDNEEKYVLSRITQLSYLRGNKREREYSSLRHDN